MTKVLWISDDIRLSTGYGLQSNYVLTELSKTCEVVCIGASVGAMRRVPMMLGEHLKLYPVQTQNGEYGSFHDVQQIVVKEKPDITILFSDPHFLTHAFALEREIHSCGPLIFWHLWDSDPYPRYNDHYYCCCDAIACGSQFTYSLLKDKNPSAIYLPLGVDTDVYRPMGDEYVANLRDDFVRRWPTLRHANFFVVAVNRNALRKRMNDILMAFDKFADRHDDVALLLHANIQDMEGAPLVEIRDLMRHREKVVLSHAAGQPMDYINDIYNFGHVHITMSCNEGYGLTTRESLAAGTPVIAPQTGGLTEAVHHVRMDMHHAITLSEEFGFLISPAVRMLAGSQATPYLYVDYVNTDDAVSALDDAYLNRDLWKGRGVAGRDHVVENYNIKKTAVMWKDLIEKRVAEFSKRSYTGLQLASV